jgi:antitoxin Phd
MSNALKKLHRGVKSASGHAWQVQNAKARFSELFRRARTEGPQRITRQGKEGVAMISDEQYGRLMVKARQPKSIVQFSGNRHSPVSSSTGSGTRTPDARSSYER